MGRVVGFEPEMTCKKLRLRLSVCIFIKYRKVKKLRRTQNAVKHGHFNDSKSFISAA